MTILCFFDDCRGARTAKYADFFHTAPNGIIGFGVPRNSDPASALSAMPALPNLPALPTIAPEVVASGAARSLPSHAPVARMTVVN